MVVIGLVQQSAWDLPIDSMPLAAGYLKAMVTGDEALRSEVSVHIHNLRGGAKLTDMARSLFADGLPDVLAFSVLGWNYRNFACLAELYKQLRPEGLVVFGGNHVSHQATKTFRECGAVDVVVNGEGEVTFHDLVSRVVADPKKPDLATVAGLSFRVPGAGHVTTADRERLQDLDVIPSPFLTGAIPMVDAEGRFPYEFALLETNRGCPYKCSFCYWGGAVGQRVRSFSRQRLVAELDFLGRHQVHTIFLCDANFGMLAADEEFVEDLLACHRRYGYPKALEANWAKNKSERFQRIVSVLKRHGFKSSFTLALQTLTDDVLETMGRRNMKLNQWEDLVTWLDAEEMDCFVELIWGAPGETAASFLEGYDRIAERVPRIAVYPLLLLPNTAYSDQRELHGFATLRGETDDFEYVMATRSSDFAENLAMQRFMFLARLLGENQYFKHLWRPARLLAGLTQSQVITSLSAWIDADTHPSVAAFRDTIPTIAESPAVAASHRLLYRRPDIDRRIETWWCAEIVSAVPVGWRAFAADVYRFARWSRPVYQEPGAGLPEGWRRDGDRLVSEPVRFGSDLLATFDALRDGVPGTPPRPEAVCYEFHGAAGFYEHLDNHEVAAHYFTVPVRV